MKKDVNKIRNAGFQMGRRAPTAWAWSSRGRLARWSRGLSRADGRCRVMVLESDAETACARWSQEVRCKPGEYYLLDATVVSDLRAKDAASGFVLCVGPSEGGPRSAERRATPGLRRSGEPFEVRAFYQAPDGVRRLSVSVGIERARGRVEVRQVRCIPILEPDARSHALAIPPPAVNTQPARVIQSIHVCSRVGPHRPVVAFLSAYFGAHHVRCEGPWSLAQTIREDAVLLPDPTPPAAIRFLGDLFRLAEEHLVVTSLPAFARLSARKLTVRKVVQPDDPIHAKLTLANAHTRGFALSDVFPYAWQDPGRTCFIQNHFRKTASLRSFLDRHGFEPLLLSVCAHDVTCDRPVCLFKATRGGGLFVLDIDPIETTPSSCGEVVPAAYLLLNVLGQSQCHLGQYAVPPRRGVDFRQQIREMSQRFPQCVLHEDDVPIDEVTDQLVTVGGEEGPVARSTSPRPLILIRTGVRSGDAESIYGAFLWFKQLLRPAPHPCPYSGCLTSRFRLAWIPSVAPWEPGDGFLRTARNPDHPTELEIESGQFAALIDIISEPVNRVRVRVPARDREYQRYFQWLPRLAATFPGGSYFAPAPEEAASFGDRSVYGWRRIHYEPEVVLDPSAFADPFCRSVLAAGGQVFRLEVPGNDFDFAANSIQRTDLVATLLEHTVGLQYGLIAVNRQPRTISFDGLAPVASGQPLVLERDHPFFLSEAARAG